MSEWTAVIQEFTQYKKPHLPVFVVWCVSVSGDWVPYPADVSQLIEQSFVDSHESGTTQQPQQQQQKQVQINKQHLVLFDSNNGHYFEVDTNENTRNVHRG